MGVNARRPGRTGGLQEVSPPLRVPGQALLDGGWRLGWQLPHRQGCAAPAPSCRSRLPANSEQARHACNPGGQLSGWLVAVPRAWPGHTCAASPVGERWRRSCGGMKAKGQNASPTVCWHIRVVRDSLSRHKAWHPLRLCCLVSEVKRTAWGGWSGVHGGTADGQAA